MQGLARFVEEAIRQELGDDVAGDRRVDHPATVWRAPATHPDHQHRLIEGLVGHAQRHGEDAPRAARGVRPLHQAKGHAGGDGVLVDLFRTRAGRRPRRPRDERHLHVEPAGAPQLVEAGHLVRDARELLDPSTEELLGSAERELVSDGAPFEPGLGRDQSPHHRTELLFALQPGPVGLVRHPAVVLRRDVEGRTEDHREPREGQPHEAGDR